MDREELLQKVRNCTPWLGAESDYPDLFGKYGMGVYGICEGWYWFEENKISNYARECGHLPLTDASDNELLTMWALADNYWLNKYQEWSLLYKKKCDKLNMFIGECERRYFGYDEDGYTDKTIDRIFKSVFEILDETFKR